MRPFWAFFEGFLRNRRLRRGPKRSFAKGSRRSRRFRRNVADFDRFRSNWAEIRPKSSILSWFQLNLGRFWSILIEIEAEKSISFPAKRFCFPAQNRIFNFFFGPKMRFLVQNEISFSTRNHNFRMKNDFIFDPKNASFWIQIEPQNGSFSSSFSASKWIQNGPKMRLKMAPKWSDFGLHFEAWF